MLLKYKKKKIHQTSTGKKAGEYASGNNYQ